jgi:hypothetical protein
MKTASQEKKEPFHLIKNKIISTKEFSLIQKEIAFGLVMFLVMMPSICSFSIEPNGNNFSLHDTIFLANRSPIITVVYPLNMSTGIELRPMCTIQITNVDSFVIVCFYDKDGSSYVLRQMNTNIASGSVVNWKNTRAAAYNTTYSWKVVVNDNGNYVTETYCFTTKPKDVVRIELVSDTHWANPDAVEHGVSAQTEIGKWMKSTTFLNPDYLFHLGDITNHADAASWQKAKVCYASILHATDCTHIYSIPGGKHDGFLAYLNKWETGFHTILNQTSQWYTVKIGNIVFVCTGYFDIPSYWASGNYGGHDQAGIFCRNKLAWLDKTLAYWNGTGNNIIILNHVPIINTTCYSYSWYAMSGDIDTYENTLIKQMLTKYTDVVGWFNGHIHTDSTSSGVDGRASHGNICNGSQRNDLPDVYFMNDGDIWYGHYPAGASIHGITFTNANFRYFDLKEGDTYIDMYAWDSTHNTSVNLSYDNASSTVSVYRMQLRYLISGIHSTPRYTQAWDFYDLSDKTYYQWIQDDQGMRRDKNGYIISVWDYDAVRNFSKSVFFMDCSNRSRFTHKIYYSNTYSVESFHTCWSTEWFDQTNITRIPDARYLMINTTITTNDVVYLRNMGVTVPGVVARPD